MSKFVKGIVKGAKKIVKGVKKVFKKITKSTLGKILLAGIVIYTGGVLFGAWGSTGPMSSSFGAWGGGAGGAASTTGAATAAAETAAVGAGSASSAALTVPTTTVGGVTLGTGAAITPGVVAPAASTGLAGYASQALGFMKANPLVTAMGFQGLASALSPDQIDIMREKEAIRRERFENLSGVGNVDIGMRASGNALRTLDDGVPWHERFKTVGG